MLGSSLQGAQTHSSTEVEYISAKTGARSLTWMCNLADELSMRMHTYAKKDGNVSNR